MKRKIFFVLFVMFIILLALSLNCDVNKQDQNSVLSSSSTEDKAADSGSGKYLINKSTIYMVEKDAVWTTTLNMLQVITKFTVTNQTLIYLDGKPAKLLQLRPGFKVTIYYYIDQNCIGVSGCYTAVRILAYSKNTIL